VLYAMIQAGSMGIPYVPVIGLAGSDLLRRRDDMKLLPDPFHPERKTVVAQALTPDVALFHGLRADRAGNVHFGYPNDNTLLAEASRTVIVTVEELVDELAPADRAATFMPGILVHGVVEARYGAHPAIAPGAYPLDGEHLTWYAAQAGSDAAFADYLRQTVFDLADHAAYVQRFVPEGWGQRGQLRLQAAGD
jgi:glutaconate CoA-transferase, subunit A